MDNSYCSWHPLNRHTCKTNLFADSTFDYANQPCHYAICADPTRTLALQKTAYSSQTRRFFHMSTFISLHPIQNAQNREKYAINESTRPDHRGIQLFKRKLSILDLENLSQYIYFYNYERIQMKTRLTPLRKQNQAAYSCYCSIPLLLVQDKLPG